MFCIGLTKCDLFIFNYVKPLLITVERNNNFIILAVSKIRAVLFFHLFDRTLIKKIICTYLIITYTCNIYIS